MLAALSDKCVVNRVWLSLIVVHWFDFGEQVGFQGVGSESSSVVLAGMGWQHTVQALELSE